MANLIDTISKAIPYNYVVGSKSESSGLPVNVKLSVDPDFKKALIKMAAIFTIGIGTGVAVGIAVAKKRSR